MEWLFWAAVGLLASLGAVELVRLGTFWLLKPEHPTPLTLVVIPRQGGDCESVIRSAAERLQWMGWKGPCQLLCLNPEEDPEVEAVSKILERRYPALRLSKQEDLVYDIMQAGEADSP